MTARSKMPAFDNLDRPQVQYLDTLGRVKESVAQLEELDSTTATAADCANKINAILAIFRTK